MSGGHFGNLCFKISQFSDELKHEIETNTVKNEYGYADNFGDETIILLNECRKRIEVAGNLAKEAEWFYSGDSSEESFVKAAGELLKNHDI